MVRASSAAPTTKSQEERKTNPKRISRASERFSRVCFSFSCVPVCEPTRFPSQKTAGFPDSVFRPLRNTPKNPRFYPPFAHLSENPEKERFSMPRPRISRIRNPRNPNLRFPRFYVAPCVYIYIGYSPYFQRPPRDRNSVESTNVRDRHISTLEI